MSLFLELGSVYISLYFKQYKVGENEFPTRILWVSVWDWDRLGKNKFLGEVRLPLSTIDFRDCSEQWYQLTEKVSRSICLMDID